MSGLKYFPKAVTVASVFLAVTAYPALATNKTCAERMPEIEALIGKIGSTAHRGVAEHQYNQAKERLAAGKEKSCQRYLESARMAYDAWEQHDD